MEHLNYLQDKQILIFLMELLVILGLTKLLSWPLKKKGFATLPAELLVGVALGPTLFGRLNPEGFHLLFPEDPLQHFMLETVGWLGILFLLLATGLEISLRSAWRQRGAVGLASLVSLALPLSLGVGLIWLLGLPSHLAAPRDPLLTAVFLGAFLATAAMPISVRILTELKVLKSDFGIFSASVLSINDLFGWLAFTTLLTSLSQGVFNPILFFQEAGLTLGVTVAALGLGLLAGRFVKLKQPHHFGREWNEGLTLLVFTGLVLGGLTTAIGIHALYGFFLAGMALSASGLVGENTRFSLSSLMESIFAPVFFAGVGLRVDFLAHFDWNLFLVFSAGALVLRYAGGWAAARLIKLPPHQQHLFGAINLAGGELHVIAGLAALEAGIIGPAVFTALVAGAIVTSLVATPLATWALNRGRHNRTLDWIPAEAVLPEVQADSREGLFRQLAEAAAPRCGRGADELFASLREREALMSTALGQGLAFPHARLPGLNEPLVIGARIPKGLADWDSPDSQPVRLAFFILTPAEHPEQQLAILKDLARAFSHEGRRRRLEQARGADAFYLAIQSGLHDAAAAVPAKAPRRAGRTAS